MHRRRHQVLRRPGGVLVGVVVEALPRADLDQRQAAPQEDGDGQLAARHVPLQEQVGADRRRARERLVEAARVAHDLHAHARAVGVGLDHEGEAELRLRPLAQVGEAQGGALAAARPARGRDGARPARGGVPGHVQPVRRGDAGPAHQPLGGRLVHRQGAGQLAREGVRHAEQVQKRLQAPVLAGAAVQGGEDDVAGAQLRQGRQVAERGHVHRLHLVPARLERRRHGPPRRERDVALAGLAAHQHEDAQRSLLVAGRRAAPAARPPAAAAAAAATRRRRPGAPAAPPRPR